jgi:hypothetical protein
VYAGTVRYAAPNFFDAATGVTLNVAAPSGTLEAAFDSPFMAGASPQSVAVGDFNGDGIPDLVTANSSDNTVTVLLGDGTGGFTAANGSPYAVGSEPLSVAAGDFDGDGNQDLVIANYGDRNLTVLLGDGAGGFTPAAHSPVAVGSNPRSVAVADFNGDGNPDLVTATAANAAVVLLGNGWGEFAVAGVAPVGFFPQSVAVADVNGDGKPDIVTANSGSNSVSVLLGNGSGGFSAASGSPIAVGIESAIRGGGGHQRGRATGHCYGQSERQHRNDSAGQWRGRVHSRARQSARGGRNSIFRGGGL